MTTIETLWHDYRPEIAGYIGKRLRDPDTTDDLVSTVYLRALVAMRNGYSWHSNARGWLYQIARSAIVDYLRSGRVPVDTVSIDTYAEEDTDGNSGAAWVERALISQEPTPYEQTEQAITQARVRHAISLLVAPQAQAVTLQMEGYRDKEVAAVMGSTVGAVKQLRVRAHATLREWLREAA